MNYQLLFPPPLVGFSASGEAIFTGDIDGDGRDEIISQHGASLNVLAYLRYGDISQAPAWQASQAEQMVTAWASLGPIAGAPGVAVWSLAAGDVLGVLDIDGFG